MTYLHNRSDLNELYRYIKYSSGYVILEPTTKVPVGFLTYGLQDKGIVIIQAYVEPSYRSKYSFNALLQILNVLKQRGEFVTFNVHKENARMHTLCKFIKAKRGVLVDDYYTYTIKGEDK